MTDSIVISQFISRCLRDGAVPVWARSVPLLSAGADNAGPIQLSTLAFLAVDAVNLVVLRTGKGAAVLYTASITDEFVRDAQRRNGNAAPLLEFVASLIEGLVCLSDGRGLHDPLNPPPPQLVEGDDDTLELEVAQEFLDEAETWARFSYTLRRSSTVTNPLEIALLEAQSRGLSFPPLRSLLAHDEGARQWASCFLSCS